LLATGHGVANETYKQFLCRRRRDRGCGRDRQHGIIAIRRRIRIDRGGGGDVAAGDGAAVIHTNCGETFPTATGSWIASHDSDGRMRRKRISQRTGRVRIVGRDAGLTLAAGSLGQTRLKQRCAQKCDHNPSVVFPCGAAARIPVCFSYKIGNLPTCPSAKNGPGIASPAPLK